MPTPVYNERTPPAGWLWVSAEVLSRVITDTHVAFESLAHWAKENSRLVSADQGWGDNTVEVVDLGPSREQGWDTDQDLWWARVWCRFGEEHGRTGYSTECACGDEPIALVCAACNRISPDLGWHPEEGLYLCRNGICANTCEGRVDAIEREHRSMQPRWALQSSSARYCSNACEVGLTRCTVHENRVPCSRCELPVPGDLMYEGVGNGLLCEQCHRTWCPYREHFADDGQRVTRVPGTNELCCSECRRDVVADSHEEYDDDGDEASYDALALTADDHRPIRTCSIEMETVNGGAVLARALYSARLTSMDNVQSYNSSRLFIDEFCHVERDSSLGENGGELIFDRVRLDDPEDQQKMYAAMQVVRNLVKDGQLGVSMACGLHIHVDAHQMGVGNVRNLVLVTNYLEDVLFRLSAAKYKRHRGTRFSQPLPKGPYPDRAAVGMHFLQSNGHESALNVGHYWSAARNNCRCGNGIVGTYENCTCNLGKCTFEFRYFNGTANFRKVQAYASLCQSLVAYSKSASDLNEEDFAPLEYRPDDRNPNLNGWDERLRWMLTNLFFSEPERESLKYVTCQSALAALGEDRLEDIFTTQYVRPSTPAQVIEHRNPRGGSSDGNPFLNEWGEPEYIEDDYYPNENEDGPDF